jgi:hypothetical protein
MNSNITTAIWLHDCQQETVLAPSRSKTLSFIQRQIRKLPQSPRSESIYLFIADKSSPEVEELSLQLI